MANIIIGGEVHCPLCGKKFKTVKTPKGETFYVCLECEVSINACDPALGKWDMLPEEKCPRCQNVMPVFYRALDGYMQHRCKCGLIIAVGKDEYLPKNEATNGK